MIFGALYRPGEVFGLSDVIAFLNERPDLVEMNQAVGAEYWQRTAINAQLAYTDSAGRLRTVET